VKDRFPARRDYTCSLRESRGLAHRRERVAAGPVRGRSTSGPGRAQRTGPRPARRRPAPLAAVNLYSGDSCSSTTLPRVVGRIISVGSATSVRRTHQAASAATSHRSGLFSCRISEPSLSLSV